MASTPPGRGHHFALDALSIVHLDRGLTTAHLGQSLPGDASASDQASGELGKALATSHLGQALGGGASPSGSAQSNANGSAPAPTPAGNGAGQQK